MYIKITSEEYSRKFRSKMDYVANYGLSKYAQIGMEFRIVFTHSDIYK